MLQLVITKYNKKQKIKIIKLNNLQDKLQALAKKFFSESILVNTLNINSSKYLETFKANEKIQEKKIYKVIQYITNNKVLGPN